MPIYTKGGDGGETGLPGARRLSKTEPIFEVLGQFDEVNASLGQAIALLDEKKDEDLIDHLQDIQSIFLGLGSCLASQKPSESPILAILAHQISRLEAVIDNWERELPKLENFILPGGAVAGAQLHYTRTLVRKAERTYGSFDRARSLPEIGRYLNRLSDFLFQAARWVNHRSGANETIWKL